MVRLNAYSKDTIAMHGPQAPLPDRPLAHKFRDAFFPALFNHPPVSMQPYLASLLAASNSTVAPTHVCFDQLLVGGNIRRFLQTVPWYCYIFSCRQCRVFRVVNVANYIYVYFFGVCRHSHGQENLFFSFRQTILSYYKLDKVSLPTKHQIIVTNKTVHILYIYHYSL
jgi:hypothetical protein